MKNLLYLAVAICLAATASSCSEKEEIQNGYTNVKLVRSIRSNGKQTTLEYDSKNRITRCGTTTFSYNGNTMTMKFSYGETYTCTLNANGYVTTVVYDSGEGEVYTEEHTYDKNGYLIHCKESYDDFEYHWFFNWDNGNLTSIAGPWDNSFTYGSAINTPINLNVFYLTDDYGCECGATLGVFGFLGRQNKNLPIAYQDTDTQKEYKFNYVFNADGTIAKVMLYDMVFELEY